MFQDERDRSGLIFTSAKNTKFLLYFFAIFLKVVWAEMNTFISVALFCALYASMFGFSPFSVRRTVSAGPLVLLQKFRPMSINVSLLLLNSHCSSPFPSTQILSADQLLRKFLAEVCSAGVKCRSNFCRSLRQVTARAKGS